MTTAVAASRSTRSGHNLPSEVAGFVGREREVAELKRLLPQTQLLTLTGTVPSLLHNLGYMALRQGDSRRALRLFRESLALFRDQGDQRGIADCLDGLAAECTNPGPGGPVLHTHHAHDELYLVLQGRYRFRIGDEEHEGGPGLFVYAPRGTTHTFASVGPEEGRIFAMSLPGLEHFLERMSNLPVRGNTREGLADLFHDFDSEINGPPLV